MEKTANDPAVSSADIDLFTHLLDAVTVQDLTGQNLEDISAKVTGFIVRCLGADHGYMMLKNEHKLTNTAGIYSNGHDDTLITSSSKIIEKVIQTGQSTIVTDVMAGNELPYDPDLQRFNITAIICAPIKTDKSVLGVI